MYCSKCGTQLPDEANFCLKCGTPVPGSSVASAPSDDKWETCEIEWSVSPDSSFNLLDEVMQAFGASSVVLGKYVAKAIGEKGVSIVGETAELRFPLNIMQHGNPPKGSATNVDHLIEKLTQTGWQPIESRGIHWFSYRFKRKVT